MNKLHILIVNCVEIADSPIYLLISATQNANRLTYYMVIKILCKELQFNNWSAYRSQVIMA